MDVSDLLMIPASEGVTILTREVDLIECEGEVWLSETGKRRSVEYGSAEAAIAAFCKGRVEWATL